MSQFLARASFNKLWRVAGKPVANLIAPVSSWLLPAGVSYNPNHDYFVNASRQRVQVSWATQPYTAMRFIPDKGHTDIALTVPGQTLVSLTDILVLWTEDLAAAVPYAWGVSIGSNLFVIHQVTNVPFGAQYPATMKLSLQEKNASP